MLRSKAQRSPRLASSRLLSLSSPLDKLSPQQKQSSPSLQRARRSGQAGLCKKLCDEFYLYLSRDKTCHKQCTIYMLPWGKTPNVYGGVTRPSRFFSWEVARTRLGYAVFTFEFPCLKTSCFFTNFLAGYTIFTFEFPWLKTLCFSSNFQQKWHPDFHYIYLS